MTSPVNINWPLDELEDKAAQAIVESLDKSPEDWAWENDLHFQIRHTSRKILVWFANGEARLDQPYRMYFNLKNWFKLRRAFKRWKRTKGNAQKTSLEKDALVKIINTLACYRPL